MRSGDKGRGRDGEELGNFEPGSDVVAKATVLAEGTQGHLTGAAIDYFELQGLQPQRWELGVKEVWEVEKPLDRVIHTMGWPLRKRAKFNEFGGSFIYPMGEDKVCVGFVAGLDYTDATFSVHDVLQQFKLHPFVKKILEGGKRVAWGAKTIPSGGYWSMPRQFSVPGMVMAGDGAGLCNVSELKGIHYAMHAGMYAAEEIVESLKKDSVNFEAYDERVREEIVDPDFYKWRNTRQAFSRGFFLGGAIASAATITQGLFPPGRWKQHEDSKEPMEIGKAAKNYPKPDGKYTFDKLSSVFASGNATRDDAPNHIRVQKHVPREVAQTWVSMCPAQVYEIPDDQLESGRRGGRPPDRPLELRPVRRHHRQGRTPDPARGRRRPALPGGLARPPQGACCPYGRGISMPPVPKTGRPRSATPSAASSGPPWARVWPKATTTSGSNWVPAQRRSSESASRGRHRLRVGPRGGHRAEGVADEDDRAPASGICSPSRPSG